MFEYGSFDERLDRQPDLHREIGYRRAYFNEKVDIDHPEQPVGAFQVGV